MANKFTSYSKTIALALSLILPFSFAYSTVPVNAGSDGLKAIFDWDSLFKTQEDNTTGIEVYVENEDDVQAASKLMTILQVLKDNYYRELSTEELLQAMSKGVANSLDSKYTYYLTPEESKAIEDEMSGEYYGIGCSLSKDETKGFEITEPNPDGPAAKAGILDGDIIIAVNGKKASDFASSQELASEVRGERGTEVEIEVFRPSDNKEYSFKIKRDKVVTQQVRSEKIAEDMAVVQIREFSNNLYPQFEKEMQSLVDDGVKKIIFDMRANPGGDAENLRKCLDLLLDEGPICSIKGRQNGKQFIEKWTTKKGKIADDMKYAILLNKNSASAAELFSGCLRDRLSVPLIGETSYGKGSGTSSWSLADASAVNVTIFEYYLPKGEAIEGKGLTPTYEVELDKEALLKEMNLSESSSKESSDLTEDKSGSQIETEKNSEENSEENSTENSNNTRNKSDESALESSEAVSEDANSDASNEASNEASNDVANGSDKIQEKNNNKLVKAADNQMQEAIEILKSIDEQVDDPTETDINDDNVEDLTGVIYKKVKNIKEFMIESKAKYKYYI